MDVLPTHSAYIDESLVVLDANRSEYLVCGVIVERSRTADVRDYLRSLALPGQYKLHWSNESERRRRQIVDAVGELDCVTAVVRHIGQRVKKTERYRRMCLTSLYRPLNGVELDEVVLESRSRSQDVGDVTHLVNLRTSREEFTFHISHKTGAQEPLLWLPDIYLGVVNSERSGLHNYRAVLDRFIAVDELTPTSE